MEETMNKTGSYKWTIEGFSKLTEKKKYSEDFYVGGIAWRLLIFPKGNNVGDLSIFLEAADVETKAQQGWSIDAQFSFTVISQIDDNVKVIKKSHHQFNAKEEDWGYSSFMQLADLNDPHKGYLVKDTCIIEATVTIESVVPPKKITETPSDPSKNTGSSAQSEKSPAEGHVVIENTQRKPLFHQFGSLKVRNPPYSLPNGYRITEGSGLDDGDMALRLLQSSLISSELQPLMEMPLDALAKQGSYHLAKFLHYHCASITSAHGAQIKHQEHANSLEELHLSLEKSAQEASKLRGDLQKAMEEKARDAEELAFAKEKIINLEGEIKLLFSENVDLQIQLEDAREAKQNVATQADEDFKASNDNNDELRAVAINSLKQATEIFCARLKNKTSRV